MGIPKFEATMRKELNSTEKGKAALIRLAITQEKLKAWKAGWLATWDELPAYFARVNAMMDEDTGRAFVETLWTKRYRGGATYCAACNNGFQALGVDCAKEAGWRVCRAQYTEPDSPLWNTRTVAFVHDELIVECPDDAQAHDVVHCLADHMVAGANIYLPDVPIKRAKMEPFLMRRWSKKAKPVHGADGRLIPWSA